MRISNWSSDVCSSDLSDPITCSSICSTWMLLGTKPKLAAHSSARFAWLVMTSWKFPACWAICMPASAIVPARKARAASETRASRSEEHTSELQSLMRISYAVFCLKKKKQNRTDDKPDDKD